MYIEMLEKVAATLYRIYYAQLEWGNPQEGHYVITGNSECRTYSDCHLPIECPTRTDLESVLFEELGSKTAAVTATTKISEKFYGPKENDFENVGLSVPHNYVVVKMERIYGKFKPDGEAKSHTVLKLYDPKISYENKLKWKGAFNVSSDFWTLNPEAKTEFLDKLKDGEFFAEIQEFKSYFHTVTACNVQSENENASFFMASFPVKYDDLSNMFGYEFEVPEGQKMATMSFHLMERIPRLYKKPLIENYPAVIAVFKKLENSSYEIFKTSCFENAFSNSIVAESYPAGKYVAVPFSVSPLTSEFHKEFDPKYTLKINSVEFKPEIKPQPISSNDYWGLFTDYVDSRLTGTISICPQGETDCKARHIQLYKMKAEGPLEIFVVHNPLDYAVEVKLDLYNFPEEDYLYSFWRGTFREHTEDNKRYFYRQTLDIVQPKTSYIANIVWHKYPSAQYVRFSLEAYKDFSDQQSTSVKPLYIAQKQTKLPESTPYDVIYKSITPLIEMPKCRHNVVS